MLTRTRKLFASLFATVLIATGAIAPAAMAQQQDGLVNVMIGDVTILRNVDVALAANVIANVCVGVTDTNVTVIGTTVDTTGVAAVVCNQRGNGRAVAITDN
jgi:hypothetical protein